MTAEELARACQGRLSGRVDPRWRLTSLSTDSRQIEPGAAFVALRGQRFDGHRFIDEAIERGARLVVCRRGSARPGAQAAFVEVADTLTALGDIAAAHRRRFDIPVLAITGSNGKTTTKELLRSILACAFGPQGVLANAGNFNNLIGLPLTLVQLRPQHRAAVVEMGMNAPGEIARLTEIARPTHALVTSIAEAHVGELGSLEAIARAKGELFAGLAPTAVALVNLDDPRVVEQAQRFSGRKIAYGGRSKLRAEEVELVGLDRTRFVLVAGEDRALIDLPLGGRHNVGNALAAAAMAHAVGIDLETISRGLCRAKPPPMRFHSERLPSGMWLVDDTYNANPASFGAALAAVAETAPGRVLVVLGDMLELGEASRRLHRWAGEQAAAAGAAFLCALGEFAESVREGARAGGMKEQDCLVAADHAAAAAAVAERWRPGDTVLVKGSRGARMERVVEELKMRGEP